MRHSAVTILVIFFAIFSLVQTGMTIFYASQVNDNPLVTGDVLQAQGQVKLCIGGSPTINFTCNTTMVEDVYYECYVNASDPDNDTLTYFAQNATGTLNFDIDINTGLFSAIPTNDDSLQDNVTISFIVVATGDCDATQVSQAKTFNIIPVNDAPVYLPREGEIAPIAPLNIPVGIIFKNLFLDDYFEDPDGDDLVYSNSFISDNFNIVILPSSEIIIQATKCGDGQVFLRATDPFGLFAESDLITLKSPCDETVDNQGSAGAPQNSNCEPKWKCDDWLSCYPNSTQKRKCYDINGCENDYVRYFWRECEYIDQCHNGIQDFWIKGYELNEDGVDCGGPCPVCETCFDNILNNGEEEIDCGGLNCDPCSNCIDGIQNYGETGIDCGGYCDPCPTCFDGIQNQDELGVDCGGSCPACRRLETPDVFNKTSRPILIILIPLAMLLLVAGVSYRLFRRQINAFIVKILWMFVRSKKKQVLLSVEQKDILLKKIKSINSEFILPEGGSFKLTHYQSAIARVLRQFFEFLTKHATHDGESLARLSRLPASSLLKDLLKHYFTLQKSVDTNKEFSFLDLNLILELTRQIVIGVSLVKKRDIARPVHEIDVFSSDKHVHVIQLLYNSILALQFEEVLISRRSYLSALELYYELSDEDQEKVYDVLHLVFKNISYVSGYVSIAEQR